MNVFCLCLAHDLFYLFAHLTPLLFYTLPCTYIYPCLSVLIEFDLVIQFKKFMHPTQPFGRTHPSIYICSFSSIYSLSFAAKLCIEYLFITFFSLHLSCLFVTGLKLYMPAKANYHRVIIVDRLQSFFINLKKPTILYM